MKRLAFEVTARERSEVAIGPDALQALDAWIDEARFDRVAIVCDEAVLDRLQRSPLARRGPIEPFAPAETKKALTEVERLARALDRAGLTRSSLLIAAGGGVTTDVGGFLGAIYLRGLTTAFVPTTLLGMVDASLGGKNGVHLDRRKNALGTIRQPAFIAIDPRFTATLDTVRWHEGLVEMLKVFAMLDADAFAAMEKAAADLQHPADVVALLPLLERALALKAEVVAKDAFEAGLREALNYGHTIGHALESWTDFALPHGLAVALGLRVENTLSASPATPRVAALLDALGITPPWPSGANATTLWPHLVRDKKAKGGIVRIAIPRPLGTPETQSIDAQQLERALVGFA